MSEAKIWTLQERQKMKNRIPEAAEFPTLRALVEQNASMIEDFNRMIATQSDQCKSIRQRLNKEIQTVNSTQFELDTANDFNEMLQTQLILARIEFNKLKGLLHPIRRCPTDLLQQIFEWTVIDQKFGDIANIEPSFEDTNAISQVSRRWRDIALRTPSLWTTMRISLRSKSEEIGEFRMRSIGRMKHKAPFIILDKIRGTAADLDVLRWYRLNNFPTIQKLQLKLTTGRAMSRLFKENVGFEYKGELRHLRVEGLYEDNDSTVQDIGQLIIRFPKTIFLDLDTIRHASFQIESPGAGNNIQRLSIRKLSLVYISLSVICNILPNVTHVELLEADFIAEPTNAILVWPKLRSLLIDSVAHFPWLSMKAPHLRELFINDIIEEGPMTFIKAHSAIKLLDTGCCFTGLRDILHVIPNLTRFNLSSGENLEILINRKETVAHEGCLEELGVYVETVTDELTLSTFNSIVQGLFLPPNVKNDRSRGKRCLKRLVLMVNERLFKEALDWYDSDLYRRADVVISYLKRWSGLYRVYTLKWT